MSAAIALLMVSLVLGGVVFAKAYPFFLSRARRKGGTHLAEMVVVDWPGLISLVLPRSIRGGWNLLVMIAITGLLTIPHWLALWNIVHGPETLRVALIAYAVTLPYWLCLAALPALFLARHQAALEAAKAAGDLTAN